MPTSKKGKNYYTKEQYQYAMYQASALEYALSKGYKLICAGKYYTMPEHDSMVFTPDGMWYWNSRGLQGKALNFMIHFEGKAPADAILELAGDRNPSQLAMAITHAPSKMPKKPPTPLPPKHASTTERLFHYLCKERKLDKNVVIHLIAKGLLYEGIKFQDGKEFHNAVFVYNNPSGQFVGAFLRGLNPRLPYKHDLYGSCKDYGWLIPHPSREPEALHVFEACIDAASHMTLSPSWEKADRLSLEGLSPKPLQNYLANHPQVKRVVLCLDNDPAGRAATQRLAELIRKNYPDVEVMVQIPPNGKDWNEYLKNRGKKLPQPEVFLPLNNTPETEI